MIPLLIIMAWEFSLPSLVYENSPFHQLHPASFQHCRWWKQAESLQLVKAPGVSRIDQNGVTPQSSHGECRISKPQPHQEGPSQCPPSLVFLMLWPRRRCLGAPPTHRKKCHPAKMDLAKWRFKHPAKMDLWMIKIIRAIVEKTIAIRIFRS
jgi:hypothetical protein